MGKEKRRMEKRGGLRRLKIAGELESFRRRVELGEEGEGCYLCG